MNTMNADHANTDVKVSTHYWGYRELSVDELSSIGGGDIGDFSDGGDRGYGDGAGYAGDSNNYSGVTVSNPGVATISQEESVAVSNSVFGISGRNPFANLNNAIAAVNAITRNQQTPTPTDSNPGGNIGIGQGELGNGTYN